MRDITTVKALTFDLFGTVLDLGGSLTPHIADFLKTRSTEVSPERFWERWRYRQRIEQYQDTLMMLGHGGYLETARRAFVWTLRYHGIEASEVEVRELMSAWQKLSPFPDVLPGLERLKTRYRLVALSNGEPRFLEHLAGNRIKWNFDRIISVETVGAFKPHPGVYRGAALRLGLEVGECMMVSSNSFDVVGARACGFKGAFVDRYGHPYEDVSEQLHPDLTVKNFHELAAAIA